MPTAAIKWRTYTGAEYDTARDIPCYAIANGYLIDEAGNPVYEDHPDIEAEIDRRGWDVYRDHGYGDGHVTPEWGAIPAACAGH